MIPVCFCLLALAFVCKLDLVTCTCCREISAGLRYASAVQEESSRYFRVGMLQYDDNGVPAFMHRTERTKFANWVNGYSLDMMRPKLVIPSFGPDIPAEVHLPSLCSALSA